VALREVVKTNADAFAEGLAQVVADIWAQGHLILRTMAAELNRRGIRTRCCGPWQMSNVRNLVGRIVREAKSSDRLSLRNVADPW
jgi:hypothetical protein